MDWKKGKEIAASVGGQEGRVNQGVTNGAIL